jgi:hypothetical protein
MFASCDLYDADALANRPDFHPEVERNAHSSSITNSAPTYASPSHTAGCRSDIFQLHGSVQARDERALRRNQLLRQIALEAQIHHRHRVGEHERLARWTGCAQASDATLSPAIASMNGCGATWASFHRASMSASWRTMAPRCSMRCTRTSKARGSSATSRPSRWTRPVTTPSVTSPSEKTFLTISSTPLRTSGENVPFGKPVTQVFSDTVAQVFRRAVNVIRLARSWR